MFTTNFYLLLLVVSISISIKINRPNGSEFHPYKIHFINHYYQSMTNSVVDSRALETAKSEIGSTIYRRMTDFAKADAIFQQQNPNAQLLQYNECKFLGLRYYVVYVRGMQQLSSDILDNIRLWFGSNAVHVLLDAKTGSGEFRVPIESVVEVQHPRSGPLNFIEELLEPRNLFIIFISLLVLFATIFFAYRVPEEDKIWASRQFGSWLISWVPFVGPINQHHPSSPHPSPSASSGNNVGAASSVTKPLNE